MSEREKKRMSGMCITLGYSPMVVTFLHIPDILDHRRADGCTLLTTIGWPEQKVPLCATLSLHRGNMGFYPPSIQSFIRFMQGDGSNNAQHCPLSLHTFRTFRRADASHPGDSLPLSPGHHRPAPQRERAV